MQQDAALSPLHGNASTEHESEPEFGSGSEPAVVSPATVPTSTAKKPKKASRKRAATDEISPGVAGPIYEVGDPYISEDTFYLHRFPSESGLMICGVHGGSEVRPEKRQLLPRSAPRQKRLPGRSALFIREPDRRVDTIYYDEMVGSFDVKGGLFKDRLLVITQKPVVPLPNKRSNSLRLRDAFKVPVPAWVGTTAPLAGCYEFRNIVVDVLICGKKRMTIKGKYVIEQEPGQKGIVADMSQGGIPRNGFLDDKVFIHWIRVDLNAKVEYEKSAVGELTIPFTALRPIRLVGQHTGNTAKVVTAITASADGVIISAEKQTIAAKDSEAQAHETSAPENGSVPEGGGGEAAAAAAAAEEEKEEGSEEEEEEEDTVTEPDTEEETNDSCGAGAEGDARRESSSSS